MALRWQQRTTHPHPPPVQNPPSSTPTSTCGSTTPPFPSLPARIHLPKTPPPRHSCHSCIPTESPAPSSFRSSITSTTTATSPASSNNTPAIFKVSAASIPKTPPHPTTSHASLTSKASTESASVPPLLHKTTGFAARSCHRYGGDAPNSRSP